MGGGVFAVFVGFGVVVFDVELVVVDVGIVVVVVVVVVAAAAVVVAN